MKSSSQLVTQADSPLAATSPFAPTSWPNFRDELRALLETLSGQATLEHLEAEFGATVTLTKGSGQLEVFVAENLGAELHVREVPTDRSYLARTLQELDRGVAVFGVRGSAYE